MMKQSLSLVMIAGFLVTTADLKAADGRYDRVNTKDGPTPVRDAEQRATTAGRDGFCNPASGTGT